MNSHQEFDGIINATKKHSFLTKQGYKSVSELKKGDEVLMCINPSKTKFQKGQVPFNKGMKGFLSEQRMGKSNPNFKHGLSDSSIKRQTHQHFHLKNVKCIACGNTKRLQIHHKNKNRRDNTKKNLQVVCISCHAKLHNTEKIRNKKGRFT